MAMPRSEGGVSLTILPSIESEPSVISSNPATSRRSVDFPAPEGPASNTKSPDATTRDIFLSAFFAAFGYINERSEILIIETKSKKKLQIRGEQFTWTESYMEYVAVTCNAARQSKCTFFENIVSIKTMTP